jgi:hypothetical protein
MSDRVAAAVFSIIVLFGAGAAQAQSAGSAAPSAPPTAASWLVGTWVGTQEGGGNRLNAIYTFSEANGAVIWSRTLNGEYPGTGQATVSGNNVSMTGTSYAMVGGAGQQREFFLTFHLQRTGDNRLTGTVANQSGGQGQLDLTKQ